MKKIITFLFILFLLSSYSCYSQSGWFWQNPIPQGNGLNSVKFVNSLVGYSVGNHGTVMKTTNGGVNWLITPMNFFGKFKSIFPIDLNFITACGDSGKIIRSTNGGINWQFLNSGISRNLNCIYFLDSYTGYCVGTYSTILKTTDQGNNWNSIYSGYYDLNSIYFWNELDGIICGDGCVLKTGNGGMNWSQISINGFWLKDIYFIDINTGFGAGIYSHYPYNDGCIFKSTNSGNNWVIILTTSGCNGVRFNNEGTGFVSIYGGVHKTTDYGLNWNNTVLNSGTSYLDYNGVSNVFIAGSGGYILKSTNAGENWISLTTPYKNSQLRSLFFVDELTGFVVGSLDSAIWKTTNSGNNWLALRGPNFSYKSVFFTTTEIGYLVTGFNIFKTTNSGNNWNSIFQYSVNPFLSIYFINQNTGYVGTYNANIYRTTNAGDNWRLIFDDPAGNIYSIHFPDNNTGYAVYGWYGPIKTTNSGDNWAYLQGLSNYFNFDKIQFRNNYTGYLMAVSSGPNYHDVILKTTNGGVNWFTSLSVLSTYAFLFDFHFTNSGIGYAVGTSGKIFKTTNWGDNWVEQYSITDNELHGILAINDSTAFTVGYNTTILKTTNGGGLPVGVFNNTENLPTLFSLSQNYPNPFNPVTRIKYDLPKSSLVKLIIYDILGREIETLINQTQKPGSYEVTWDGSRYASGVYFYKLITDEYVVTKKMVLIK